MAGHLPASEMSSEQCTNLLMKGYALLLDEARPVPNEVRPAIEKGTVNSARNLLDILKARPAGSTVTAIETGGRIFSEALVRNYADKQRALLDGEAYHLGQTLLRIFVREGSPLPTYAADKY